MRDPLMEGILTDTEHMLAQGRMDLPLSLCFAAVRGDDLLLQQLLRRGSDPNEVDSHGRTALHIAAAKGSEHCAVLLLEYGADPNIKDSEGSVPLWEAIFGSHKSVIKLLVDNGAKISAGDVGHFACIAVEQNNLDLLKEITNHGGDITLAKNNGSTALHAAISEGNTEIVKFLLDQGAAVDKPDVHGWTAWALVEHQGNEDMKVLFQDGQQSIKPPVVSVPKMRPLAKYSSEPCIPPHANEPLLPEVTWTESHHRRRANNFQNSLFGIMSAANTGDKDPIGSTGSFGGLQTSSSYSARVTLNCPEKNQSTGKLVLLPKSLAELLNIGANKFGISPTKILTTEGAEIDDIELIRDGDHLIIVSDAATEYSTKQMAES